MTFYSHYVSTAGINPGSATTAAFFDINVMLASRLHIRNRYEVTFRFLGYFEVFYFLFLHGSSIAYDFAVYIATEYVEWRML